MMGIEILKDGGVSWKRRSDRREGKQIDKLEQTRRTREGNVRSRQAGGDKLEQTSWSREGHVTHRRKVIR
jgi:hypothetical protein